MYVLSMYVCVYVWLRIHGLVLTPSTCAKYLRLHLVRNAYTYALKPVRTAYTFRLRQALSLMPSACAKHLLVRLVHELTLSAHAQRLRVAPAVSAYAKRLRLKRDPRAYA